MLRRTNDAYSEQPMAHTHFLLYSQCIHHTIPTTNIYIQSQSARIFDQLFDNDVCYDEAAGGTIGTCDSSKFPTCDPDTTLICYNRRPRRDEFHIDIRQPKYYIDYRSVYCYPNTFQGCSSCSPGRFCRSEERCILEELDYPCSEWI